MFYKIVLFCFVVFKNTCLCSEFEKTEFESPDLTKVLRTSDYIEVRNSVHFIDKTLLIYKTLNNEEPLLFTAPPGFGKSTNLDMYRIFLSNIFDQKKAHDIFADTNIAKDSLFVKTHLGKHPVIYCSFKQQSVTDHNTMVANFRTSLHKAFLQHKYLESSKLLTKDDLNQFKKFVSAESYTSLELSEISSSLHFLSKVLKTHFDKPVILLIDDYDSVIWESLLTPGLKIKDVLGFYNTVLENTLSDKDNVKNTILTGTSCILFNLLPAFRKTKCVKFLHDKEFEPFFGITGDEVDYLVDRTVYVSLRLNLTEWYNGYTSPDFSAHIHNTKSLMKFFYLSEGQLISFWSNNKVEKFLRILLEDNVRKELLLDTPETLMFVVRELNEVNEGVLEGVKNMVTREIWDANVSDLYIHLLMEQGYFTFHKPWERSGYNSSVTFKLANLDVCEALKNYTWNYIREKNKMRSNIYIG